MSRIREWHQGVIDAAYHGRLIRLTGIVRSLSPQGFAKCQFLLESNGFQVPVDYSSIAHGTPFIDRWAARKSITLPRLWRETTFVPVNAYYSKRTIAFLSPSARMRRSLR